MLTSPLADGQCIIDLTQTSFPSHVQLMQILTAAHVIQDQCVEKDTPPCTYSLNASLCIYPLNRSIECIGCPSREFGHESSGSDSGCV